LEVWKKSITLIKSIYRVRNGFPQEERYGLVDRIKRSAVLISANIACPVE